MKQSIFFILLFFSVNAQAQFDLSVNPVSPIFGQWIFSGDFHTNKSFSIGGDVWANDHLFYHFVNGRYFFNTNKGADRFNVGAFAGAVIDDSSVAVGGGGLIGYKIVTKTKLFFDFSIGLGVGNEDDYSTFPYLRTNIGYRFSKQK